MLLHTLNTHARTYVAQDATLVEHALRMTLVADSLSLQFRLPAPDLAEPVARSSAAIAGADGAGLINHSRVCTRMHEHTHTHMHEHTHA